MSKWQKKPLVIEAFKWTGSLGTREESAPPWFTDAICTEDISFVLGTDQLSIETLEGTFFVSPGDYVIRGINGELYPCKPDIFHKTYDKVEE